MALEKVIADGRTLAEIYVGITDPGANHDGVATYGSGVGQRFQAGMIWRNEVSGEVFMCTGNTTGAAVWKSLTSAGTNFGNQNANRIYGGPGSGGAAAPGFRALVLADIPTGTGPGTVPFIDASTQVHLVQGKSQFIGNADAHIPVLITARASQSGSLLDITNNAGDNHYLTISATGVMTVQPNGGGTFIVDVNGGTKASGRTVSGVATVAFASTVTPNCDAYNVLNIGQLTNNITIGAPTGTPVDGQWLTLRFTTDGTPGRTITWNAAFAFGTDVTAAMITSAAGAAGAKFEVGFQWNAADSKWRCMAVARGF